MATDSYTGGRYRGDVAVCRSCDWATDGSEGWVESVEEEADLHAFMLNHEVDYGKAWSLIKEACSRGADRYLRTGSNQGGNYGDR